MPGGDRRGDRRVARPGPLAALVAQALHADAQPVQDGDRRASTASGPCRPTRAPRRSPSRSAACAPSRRPPRPAAPRAAIAMPGEAIHAFWLALTTRSTPHASISNGMAPSPLMPSTTSSGSPGRAAHDVRQLAHRVGDAGRGLVVGDQHGAIRIASVQVRRGARPGRRRVPHSTSNRSTSAPNARRDLREPIAERADGDRPAPGRRATACSRRRPPARPSRSRSGAGRRPRCR